MCISVPPIFFEQPSALEMASSVCLEQCGCCSFITQWIPCFILRFTFHPGIIINRAFSLAGDIRTRGSRALIQAPKTMATRLWCRMRMQPWKVSNRKPLLLPAAKHARLLICDSVQYYSRCDFLWKRIAKFSFHYFWCVANVKNANITKLSLIDYYLKIWGQIWQFTIHLQSWTE